MRRASNKDANHRAIVEALRSIGASVTSLDAPGVPDLLVGFGGMNFLLEVKNPKTAYGRMKADNASGSLERQRAWREAWKGNVIIVTSPWDACARVATDPLGPRVTPEMRGRLAALRAEQDSPPEPTKPSGTAGTAR